MSELLTVPEVANLLRTTPKAIYAMVERQALPGLTRVGRRLLFKSHILREHFGLLPSPPPPLHGP